MATKKKNEELAAEITSGISEGSVQNSGTASSAPTYSSQYSLDNLPQYDGSKYQPMIDEWTDKLLNREAFSYDYTTDPKYQQFAQEYKRNGEQAMEDTLGKVAARTGGLASSYATGAAQQQYNNYMGQLNDKIPELEQLAYEMYLGEGDRMSEQLALLRGLEGDAYGRYRDQWNDQVMLEGIDYDRAWNEDERAYNRAWNEDERSYNRTWNEDERAYNRTWNEDERAYNRTWNEDERAYNRAWDKADADAAAKAAQPTYTYGYNDTYTDVIEKASGYMDDYYKALNSGSKDPSVYKNRALAAIYNLEANVGAFANGQELAAALAAAGIDESDYEAYRDQREGKPPKLNQYNTSYQTTK